MRCRFSVFRALHVHVALRSATRLAAAFCRMNELSDGVVDGRRLDFDEAEMIDRSELL